MQVYRGIEEIGKVRKAVISTGSFDGVHIGHKVLLNRLNALAAESGGESVLITFHPHPRKVLYPETAGKELKLINTQREKIKLLEKTGLDHLLIIPFTLEFSRMSSVDFIRKILVEKFNAATVVIGFNHHFGHNREGDYEYLYELGRFYNFTVEEIPEQDIENEAVSSTRIRKALKEGHIQRANAYLDHHYIIMGRFGEGAPLPEFLELGAMSMEIEEEEKLLPPPGLYAADASIGPEIMKCLVGIHASLENDKQVVWVHILEEGMDWSGLDGSIRFQKKLWLGDLNQSESPMQQINSAKSQTEELIY